jgi:hypothetical protein
MKAELRVNREPRAIEADGDTPLLGVLRDHLRMTGTKFGCGIGQCSACTVHINAYPCVGAAIHKAAAGMHAAQNPVAFSISIGRWGAILKAVQASKAAGYATEVAV